MGIGRSPVSKHQIQPEYGDEQPDAGRDYRIRLARPNSQRDRRHGNIHFLCSADHEQDWRTYPVDPYLLYSIYISDDNTYIHTGARTKYHSRHPQRMNDGGGW